MLVCNGLQCLELLEIELLQAQGELHCVQSLALVIICKLHLRSSKRLHTQENA